MYAPLQYLENCENQRKIIAQQSKENEGHSLSFINTITGGNYYLDDDSLLAMGLRMDFHQPFYNGPNKDIHKVLTSKKVSETLKQCLGRSSVNGQYITDIRDFLVMQPILNRWGQNKQVYKFDKEFAQILIATDKLKLYRDILDHLPYNTFYIDLSQVDIPCVHGEFVTVYKDAPSNMYVIVVYVLAQADDTELLSFSHYSYFSFVDDYFDVEKPQKLSYSNNYLSDSIEDFVNKDIIKHNNSLDDIDRMSLTMLALQFLMYIGSHEPDISENPLSKQTFKAPVGKPKNSFKEVRTWDVGVTYGNSIRILNKKLKKKIKEDLQFNELPQDTKKRKAPRPHMRCAHWQRYHVGEGRKETVVKWIPPVMVIGTEEVPVIIHHVS